MRTGTIEMVLCRQFNSITNGERCADGGDEHWIIEPTHRISIDNSHRARRSTHPQENFVDSYFTFRSRGGIFFVDHNPSYFRRNPKLCSFLVENRTHSQFFGEKKQHKIQIWFFFFHPTLTFPLTSVDRRNLKFDVYDWHEQKNTVI